MSTATTTRQDQRELPGAPLRGHSSSRDALPLGVRMGEYEIDAVIGEGGFGIVYLATDHELERQVAIKEYLPITQAVRGPHLNVTLRGAGHAEPFERGLASFVREARLLAAFDHPSLMRVLRFWKSNGTAYMVMPYYEGQTLLSMRESMARPPEEAWLRKLLTALAGALQTLHAGSCVHRDIAPDNVMLLPEDGRPVLLDFGAARRIVPNPQHPLTAILKPSYAPIEQYAEAADLPQGPWTDLYALGALARFCITGEAPPPSTVRAVRDSMPRMPEVVARLAQRHPGLHYSDALLHLIDTTMSVRPQDRPANVAEFLAVLEGSPLERDEPHPASRGESLPDLLVTGHDEADEDVAVGPEPVVPPRVQENGVATAAGAAAGAAASATSAGGDGPRMGSVSEPSPASASAAVASRDVPPAGVPSDPAATATEASRLSERAAGSTEAVAAPTRREPRGEGIDAVPPGAAGASPGQARREPFLAGAASANPSSAPARSERMAAHAEARQDPSMPPLERPGRRVDESIAPSARGASADPREPSISTGPLPRATVEVPVADFTSADLPEEPIVVPRAPKRRGWAVALAGVALVLAAGAFGWHYKERLDGERAMATVDGHDAPAGSTGEDTATARGAVAGAGISGSARSADERAGRPSAPGEGGGPPTSSAAQDARPPAPAAPGIATTQPPATPSAVAGAGPSPAPAGPPRGVAAGPTTPTTAGTPPPAPAGRPEVAGGPASPSGGVGAVPGAGAGGGTASAGPSAPSGTAGAATAATGGVVTAPDPAVAAAPATTTPPGAVTGAPRTEPPAGAHVALPSTGARGAPAAPAGRQDATPGSPATAAVRGGDPGGLASPSPRAVCGTRTQFSLYYCMQQQCRKAQYAGHPQCKALRERDEVARAEAERLRRLARAAQRRGPGDGARREAAARQPAGVVKVSAKAGKAKTARGKAARGGAKRRVPLAAPLRSPPRLLI